MLLISPYHQLNECLQCFAFKLQIYLEFKYTVTKTCHLCNSNIRLNNHILLLIFMFDYIFEIKPDRISTKNWQSLHPDHWIFPKLCWLWKDPPASTDYDFSTKCLLLPLPPAYPPPPPPSPLLQLLYWENYFRY